MAEKEGGDPEKKMTKDFLERWKKIAEKYEGPEEKEEGVPPRPKRTEEEELEAFLSQVSEEKARPKPEKPTEEEAEEDLLKKFGLAAPAAPPKPEGELEARPPAAVRPPEAPAPSPAPAKEEPSKIVLETLRKVGLVRPAPAAPPAVEIPQTKKGPAPPAPEEEEEQLLSELEALLAEEGPRADEAAPAERAPSKELFEEETLAAELEKLMADEAREEKPPEKAAPPPPARVAPKPAAVPEVSRKEERAPVRSRPAVAPIKPPVAPRTRKVVAPQRRGRGRVNATAVARRPREGRVNGGRVNGGRVNGGRVNGGRVNGGRVNGGRVNGGRINGGALGLRTASALQMRRQRLQALAAAVVATIVFAAAIFGLGLFQGRPPGPAVDGDLSDWGGALRFTDAREADLPPFLDLREYGIRADEQNRLWFFSTTEFDLFSRPTAAPGLADVLTVLVDIDGSALTGYRFGDLGVDRIAQVSGWDGAIKSSTTKLFGTGRGVDDWAGFEPSGGLQVVAKGKTIEGELTRLGGSTVPSAARAAFLMRGVDSQGALLADRTAVPATLGRPAIGGTETQVAQGVLLPGASDAPMLSLVISNPTASTISVQSITVTARYFPALPSYTLSASVWTDSNSNLAVDRLRDSPATVVPAALPDGQPTAITLTGLSVPPGDSQNLLVSIDSVPTPAQNGSSLILSIDSPSGIFATGNPLVTLLRAPPPAGRHPGSYLGAPPSEIAVDGITGDWAGQPEGPDASGDVLNPHIDFTSLRGNATASGASFLVSFASNPLEGALIPEKLPSTVSVPSTGGGGGGQPFVPPPNLGTDLLIVMVDQDDLPTTGLLIGSHGFDFAIRVEGKDGAVLPGSAKLLKWETTPSPAWLELSGAPEVALGASSVELRAPIPPFVLGAANVSVRAFATDWQGLKDDVALIMPNDPGSRGQAQSGLFRPVGEPTIWPRADIPEFSDLALPLAGVLLMFGLTHRGRRKVEAAQAS